jgi:tryptophan halogenase
LAALTLKRLLPELNVSLVYSKDIGIIGVGEGTTAIFPDHLFRVLGISRDEFYREAEPTWKQGLRFIWGPRDEFFYDFDNQYDRKFDGVPRANGYYAQEDCTDLSPTSALMHRGKAFATGPLGKPVIKGNYAFHIENHKLVTCLESIARKSGIEFHEDTLDRVEREGAQITALHFKSGATRAADLYVDASGFRSELLGREFQEPFVDFSNNLFCDRAVIGGWQRTDEPILPYTTCETMDRGWAWQIEHETFINRGYVYSSPFVSDDEALAELLRKNPKISTTPRVVKFRSGHYRRCWIGNVVAIGNSSGFVEPLEATALGHAIHEASWLAGILRLSQFRPGEAEIAFYNRTILDAWNEIRDFLCFHYKFNTRLDTPFWRHCREDITLGNYQDFYDLYREVGPSPELLAQTASRRPNIFGTEGFLAILVGTCTPHGGSGGISGEEVARWDDQRQRLGGRARTGASVRQALDATRKPGWNWA